MSFLCFRKYKFPSNIQVVTLPIIVSKFQKMIERSLHLILFYKSTYLIERSLYLNYVLQTYVFVESLEEESFFFGSDYTLDYILVYIALIFG